MTEIPRKLHADERHPLAPQMRVYVDGDELRHVICYDMDAGTVTHHVHTDEGKLLVVRGEFATRTRHGRVTVSVRV